MKRNHLIAATALTLILLSGCGGNRISVPFDSSDCMGMAYSDAMDQLNAAGFTEISTEEVSTNRADSDGNISSVVIDDKTIYSAGDKWEPTVPVKVRYYVLEQFEPTMTVETSGDVGEPVFSFLTNLPNKTELVVTLENGEGYEETQTIKVKNGEAETDRFRDNRRPLEGDYTLTCSMRMEDQPGGVKDDLGEKGDCLTGRLVQQGEDGEKYLVFEHRYTSDYVSPVAIPQEEMDALLEATLDNAFGEDYNLMLTGMAYTVELWADGLAMTATLAKAGDVTSAAVWEDLRTSVADLSASLYNLLEANGHGDKFASVTVLNDIDHQYTLLTAGLGYVTYDCVEE